MAKWNAGPWHLNRDKDVPGTVSLVWFPRRRVPLNHAVCSIFISSDNKGKGLPGVRTYHKVGLYVKELDARNLSHASDCTVMQYVCSNCSSRLEAEAVRAQKPCDFFDRRARVLDKTETIAFVNLKYFFLVGTTAPLSEEAARRHAAQVYASAVVLTARFKQIRHKIVTGYKYWVRIPTNARFVGADLAIEPDYATRMFTDMSIEFRFECVLYLLLIGDGPYPWDHTF